jgi:hypothetical protein
MPSPRPSLFPDTTQLVRVIVLKPLAMQMFQLLVRKLGGMLNRHILYLPISRSLGIDAHQARQIRQMYEECIETGCMFRHVTPARDTGT